MDLFKKGDTINEIVVSQLLDKLNEINAELPNVLLLHAPITICGDIHGQLFDLGNLFLAGGDIKDTQYLFMGDYVDRGYQSIQTFLYLAFLKVKYPQQIHLLRGNHEARSVNFAHGLSDSSLKLYNTHTVYKLLNESFDLLPCCAVIDQRVFSVHGGISRHAPSLMNIQLCDRFREIPSAEFDEVTDNDRILIDLYWSDPSDDVEEYARGPRGAGSLYGRKAFDRFMHFNHLNLLTRSHQMAEEGFHYYFGDRLLLVWSAPNYMYTTNSKATVLKLDEHHNRRLVGFEAHEDSAIMPDTTTLSYFV
ncbi:Ser/Thr protein phosphatase [Histomonas meleagridis]|uniref:Ser/Thr protein phosphatase n=1 Tax=Histomonas meleagridis TaxID=135588 RepID=UPI00355AAD09|nr:Ser/Thr protein phosphatase [Histomonas meleagridis]